MYPDSLGAPGSVSLCKGVAIAACWAVVGRAQAVDTGPRGKQVPAQHTSCSFLVSVGPPSPSPNTSMSSSSSSPHPLQPVLNSEVLTAEHPTVYGEAPLWVPRPQAGRATRE